MALIIYSDLNVNADKSPLSKNAQAVVKAVKNILWTELEERLNNPTFGSRLKEYLFEPIDDITAYAIENEIISAINRWDNRASIDPETVIIPYPDDNRYDFNLIIRIIGLEEDSVSIKGSLYKQT